MAQRALEVLSPSDCYTLLASARVGRLVYVDELGPLAIPVNFALAGTDVVIRVEGGQKRAAMQQPVLGFEVDHIDEDEGAGWSVLVRGRGTEVPLDDVPELLRRMAGPPTPWAEGVHAVWLKIEPIAATGRRLGRGRPPLPVP